MPRPSSTFEFMANDSLKMVEEKLENAQIQFKLYSTLNTPF